MKKILLVFSPWADRLSSLSSSCQKTKKASQRQNEKTRTQKSTTKESAKKNFIILIWHCITTNTHNKTHCSAIGGGQLNWPTKGDRGGGERRWCSIDVLWSVIQYRLLWVFGIEYLISSSLSHLTSLFIGSLHTAQYIVSARDALLFWNLRYWEQASSDQFCWWQHTYLLFNFIDVDRDMRYTTRRRRDVWC